MFGHYFKPKRSLTILGTLVSSCPKWDGRGKPSHGSFTNPLLVGSYMEPVENKNNKTNNNLERFFAGVIGQQHVSLQSGEESMDTENVAGAGASEVNEVTMPQGSSSSVNTQDIQEDMAQLLKETADANDPVDTGVSANAGEANVVPSAGSSLGTVQTDTDTGSVQQKRHPKRSGAERKRMTRLVNEGMTLEEARLKCKDSAFKGPRHRNSHQQDRGPKRNRSDTTITPQADKRAKTSSGAIPLVTRPRLSYKDVVASVKVGIVPNNFPERKLTYGEMDKLRLDVLQLIYVQREQPFKPRFTSGAISKAGWLVFHCSDKETAEWLKLQNLWADRGLLAVDEEEFPTGHILVGYFKQSADMDNEFILGVIKGQNAGLDTETWKTVQRRTEDRMVIMTLEVNEASLDTLKKTDLTVHYGFGQTVKFKVKGKASGSEPAPGSSSTPRNNPDTDQQNGARPSTSKGSGGSVTQRGSDKDLRGKRTDPPQPRSGKPRQPRRDERKEPSKKDDRNAGDRKTTSNRERSDSNRRGSHNEPGGGMSSNRSGSGGSRQSGQSRQGGRDQYRGSNYRNKGGRYNSNSNHHRRT